MEEQSKPAAPTVDNGLQDRLEQIAAKVIFLKCVLPEDALGDQDAVWLRPDPWRDRRRNQRRWRTPRKAGRDHGDGNASANSRPSRPVVRRQPRGKTSR